MAKTRLQFDFTDEALGELDELKGATGATNRAEVIRQALRLLQDAGKRREIGRNVSAWMCCELLHLTRHHGGHLHRLQRRLSLFDVLHQLGGVGCECIRFRARIGDN